VPERGHEEGARKSLRSRLELDVRRREPRLGAIDERGDDRPPVVGPGEWDRDLEYARSHLARISARRSWTSRDITPEGDSQPNSAMICSAAWLPRP
jgi:hypothetical protein